MYCIASTIVVAFEINIYLSIYIWVYGNAPGGKTPKPYKAYIFGKLPLLILSPHLQEILR